MCISQRSVILALGNAALQLVGSAGGVEQVRARPMLFVHEEGNEKAKSPVPYCTDQTAAIQE